jgi:dihydrodipicolinate synthase/N-acetylneuraminate lyase
MNPHAITSESLAASVVAVPPLARDDRGKLDIEQNRKLIRYLEQGGIRTLLYGGNAVLYHVALSEYGELLQLLTDAAGDATRVIPSIGPAYGMAMDQVQLLRESRFPTAMVLPQRDLTTPAGVAQGIRRIAERWGRPVVLYLKHEGYIDVAHVKRLMDDGCLSWIKYAIVREDPAEDDVLRELVQQVDPRWIVSGIGEQPAVVHLRDFGLVGFTSGCVCVAPRLSQKMLRAVQAGDIEAAERVRAQCRPLEDLRNQIHPVRVLHAAVAAAGIAETGPLLPLLSDVDDQDLPAIAAAARELRERNREANA